ncbi:hypothetical protein Tco_1248867, partial [Tanacetum coccineum]
MRPSHHLCSLVPSIHRSSAAISDRLSHDSSSVSLSRKRSKSPTASVLLSSPTLGALSYACADLLPSPKRIKSPEIATDLEGCSKDSFEPYVPKEAGLGVDFEDESSELFRYRGTDLDMDDDILRSDGIDIDLEIQAEIDECIAYANALRDRGIDARAVVEAIDRGEIETGVRGPVEDRVDSVTHPVVTDDIPKPAHEGVVGVTYVTLEDLVQRFHDHTEEILAHRVQVIESVQRDQGHKIVATRQQSVDMLERIRELERDNRRFRDMMDVASQRVARNGGNRNEGNGNGGNRNGGNRNGRNGNGNGNGGGNGYNFIGFVPAREYTYQDFLKCQTLSFNGTEGVVGLTRWFEKIEIVFHISNCPEKYQVKNEVQKMEIELWNLVVKGNDLTAYTRRFQELVLLCTRMVPNKEDKAERFIGGLPDNIQGNVIAAEPTKLQDAIRIANNLMDQKLKGYARSA